MNRTAYNLAPDPAVAARLRLARLPDGARVRLSGRSEVFTYHGQSDGLAILRAGGGAELRAGCLAVSPLSEEA